MRLVWQARPSYSLSRPPSIGNWRRQTTPSSGISITLIGISIGINTSVGIGEKWKNSPREICPSASVRMRGRDILPPSFHNHTDHWGNQQRSAKISKDQRKIRSDQINLLRRPPTDWSRGSLSRLLLLLSVLLRTRVEIGSVPSSDPGRAGGCSTSSGQFILGQNPPTKCRPGAGAILNNGAGGRRGNKNCRQIWRMNYNWLADTGGNEMIIWLENEITYNLHLHSGMKFTQDDLNRKYKAAERKKLKRWSCQVQNYCWQIKVYSIEILKIWISLRIFV